MQRLRTLLSIVFSLFFFVSFLPVTSGQLIYAVGNNGVPNHQQKMDMPITTPQVRDAFLKNSSSPITTIRLRFLVMEDTNGDRAVSQYDVDNQVLRLNAIYAPLRINFNYVTNFIVDGAAYDIASDAEVDNMKMAHHIDPEDRLQIYVCNTSNVAPNGIFPWEAFINGTVPTPRATDMRGGVFIPADGFHKFSTLAHEIGHCLGLYHTHHGADAGTSSASGGELSCTNDPLDVENIIINGTAGNTWGRNFVGDLCGDTPASPNFGRLSTSFGAFVIYTNSCYGPSTSLRGAFPKEDCQGEEYEDHKATIPYYNLMGYNKNGKYFSNDCRTDLTDDQNGRVHANLRSYPIRGWVQTPAFSDPFITITAPSCIRVGEPASFTLTVNRGDLPQEVFDYTDLDWLINFGEGTNTAITSGNETEVGTFTYATPGTKTMTVSLLNRFFDVITTQITVNILPAAPNSSTGTMIQGPLSITNDVTWSSGTYYVKGLITIQAGASLTIQPGATVEFMSGQVTCQETGINVLAGGAQCGGTLVLNGCTLKGLGTVNSIAYNDMWRGIKVYGNDVDNLTTGTNGGGVNCMYNAGYVELNNATIQDALIGISTLAGGAIKARNSDFINNVESVRMEPLFSPIRSKSTFTQCNFICNGALLNGSSATINQVYLAGHDLVQFKGNVFSNTASTAGVGIYAHESAIRVIRQCTSIPADPTVLCGGVPNRFEGLSIGIRATGIPANGGIYVDGNVFDRDGYGIWLQGTGNSRIFRNQFIIPKGTDFFKVGILNESCSSFFVEQNTFTLYGSPGIINWPELGVVSIGSNAGGGVINKNNFPGGLTVDNYFAGQNTHLTIQCNSNNSDMHDWAIVSGKLMNQGNCNTIPASENFKPYYYGYGHLWHYSDNNPATRFYYNSENGLEPSWYNAAEITVTPCTSGVNECSSNINGSGGGGMTNISSHKMKVEDFIFQKQEAINQLDGGATAELLYQMQPDHSISADELFSVLESHYPLSEAVLVDAVFSVMEESQLEAILVQNSSLPAAVWSAIEQRPVPLSAEVLEALLEAQGPQSLGTQLEATIEQLESLKNASLSTILYDYTCLNDTPTAIDYLIDLGDDEAKRMALPLLAHVNTELARELVEQLPGNNEEDIEFREYYEVIFDLIDSGLSIREMDAAQEYMLRGIATGSSRVSAQAESVLQYAYGEDYSVELLFPFLEDEAESGERGSIKGESTQTSAESVIAFPNPASDEVLFRLISDGPNQEGKVSLLDISGHSLAEFSLSAGNSYTLQLLDLPQGVYYYVIKLGDQVLEPKKLVIVKQF